MGLTKPQLDSAQEFATAAVAALSTDGRFHPGTVIVATARMAGTYLFRSFRLKLPDLPPGQAVLSNEASELGPMLIQTAARLLGRVGIALDPSKAGQPPPRDHEPRFCFLETQPLLDAAFLPVRTKYGFDDAVAAHAVAAAVALLIRHCQTVLDPSDAFGIAAFGFVEGTKTVPTPLPDVPPAV
jgi:hypothetical protein